MAPSWLPFQSPPAGRAGKPGKTGDTGDTGHRTRSARADRSHTCVWTCTVVTVVTCCRQGGCGVPRPTAGPAARRNDGPHTWCVATTYTSSMSYTPAATTSLPIRHAWPFFQGTGMSRPTPHSWQTQWQAHGQQHTRCTLPHVTTRPPPCQCCHKRCERNPRQQRCCLAAAGRDERRGPSLRATHTRHCVHGANTAPLHRQAPHTAPTPARPVKRPCPCEAEGVAMGCCH